MAGTARVIVLEEFGVLRIEETSLPGPGPHECAVQVFAAGVGHAQLQQVAGAGVGCRLMGTEGIGRVMAVGSAVTLAEPGEIVAITPFRRAEAGHRPAETRVLELDSGETIEAPGLFTWATTALVAEAHVVPIEDLRDRDAAAILGETLVLGFAAIRAPGAVAGKRVGVAGTGGVGLGAVAAARLGGARSIVAIGRDSGGLARAGTAGATEQIHGGPDAVAAALGQDGLDVFVDCPSEYPLKARPGRRFLRDDDGVAVLAGPAGTSEEAAHLHRLCASGAYLDAASGIGDMAELVWEIRALAGNGLELAPLVTRYTIESVNEAVRDLENGSLSGAGIIVMEALR